MQHTDEELEAELERFVTYGNLLDRRTRRYLADYLRAKISVGHAPDAALNDRYATYLRRAIDEIFQVDRLLFVSNGNQAISRQIVLDTLYWLKKSFREASTEHPFAREMDFLRGWSVTPLREVRTRYPHLLQFLEGEYVREELDTGFYRHRFDAYYRLTDPDATQAAAFERILTDLLSQWDALLQARILEFRLRKLDQHKEEYLTRLERKVEEYRQLRSILDPFTDYLGWDMSRDLWQSTSFDVLRSYDALLTDEQSVQELADLLGKMREAEIELEEETFEKTIVRQEWVTDEQSRAEIVGVRESSDLSHMLSSEAALLSQVDTETAFLKKFADHSLLTLQFEDRHLRRNEEKLMEIDRRVRKRERGPFIVCVDTSQSMMGRPEEIAKVLTLGILKMAVRSDRRAYLISFSTGIQTLDLHDVANSIDELARFLNMSFYGGTDATLALYEALRQLRTHDYRDADVLMISDFVMYKIDRDVLDEIAHFQHNKATEFHSLALAREANAEVLGRFDTNWIYDPERKGVIRELTRGLATIGER